MSTSPWAAARRPPTPDDFGDHSERSLIILNPVAGQGDAVRVRRQLGGAFAARGVPFDLVETTGAGDAERAARRAAERGYRSVVAVGGDGTVAEAITGLAGSHVPLGIIPQGTGNQVAGNLGIPTLLDRAVEVATQGMPHPMDIGVLDEQRYFALIAGAGWDAEVMTAATRQLKDRWGFGAYLLAGARRAVTPPSAHFTITADGESFEVDAATVLVANVGHLFHELFPVDLKIGPEVSFHDGLLDICIFAPKNLPQLAGLLWKVALRRYTGDERMLYLQAREIRIECDPPIATQVDGDPYGVTPLVARAVPDGVRVLLPA